ncbi:hypothetical protein CCR75_007109 [Bremia lactucae]|uniref:Calponin-homology (CH) domain-containing protein n=1 Tax=Bremia lactucae TaxID=4779 RepID=A0A976IJF3_BRELC|nr:hypothetical protein CCR75_007109 [Bremia lactucae]
MLIRSPVQVRGGGYGLDAELARKAAQRYDYDMEDEAREWLETISEMAIGDDFGEGLRDGIILCTVANKIHPGVVTRIETKSKMPFKLMENVSAFLKACRVMGVNEFDLFETVDLFELKDLGNVVRCIFSLGRAVQRDYQEFKGPSLGVKESSKNQRTFTLDQIAGGKNIPAQQTLGSYRTMQRQTTFHTNKVMLGAAAAQSAYRAPPPPPPPSAEKIEQLSRFRNVDHLAMKFSHPKGESSPSKHAPTKAEIDATVAELTDEEGAATLDKRVASTMPRLTSIVKSAPTAEEEAQKWIEAVLSEKFLASFGDSLKDGVMLCSLMNKIKPGMISRIQTAPMPFKQMENISAFVRACRTIGVAEFELFETVDLYNQTNLGQVVQCIHALGRTIQKTMPNYDGPLLGVKESSINPRQFTEAQLYEAAAAVPILATASQSVMERLPCDHSTSVTFRYDTAINAAATADVANSETKLPQPLPENASKEVSAVTEVKLPIAEAEAAFTSELEQAEAEVAPTSALKQEDSEVAPTSKVTQDPAQSIVPGWLSQRVASMNLGGHGNVAKSHLPVGGSSSALPTRTVWS